MQLQRAAEVVLTAQLADRAELHVVLMQVADERRLKVVAGLTIEVRQRIKAEQRLRLRADAVQRDSIAGGRLAGNRVDHLHGQSLRGERLRKVALAFSG